jgi:hypothetical protein
MRMGASQTPQGSARVRVTGSTLNPWYFTGVPWAEPASLAASIRTIVKTPVLYSDPESSGAGACRAEFVYQLRDSLGRSDLLPSGIAVRARLEKAADPSQRVSWACGASSGATGVGQCSFACTAAVESWFSEAADVPVLVIAEALSGGSVAAVSLPSVVVLKRLWRRTASTEPGVTVELGLEGVPRFPGETIAATLWGNTDAYALDRWAVKLTFDGSTMRYLEGSFAVNGALFAPAVIKGPAGGVLSASAVRLQSTAEGALVSGRLRIATLTMQVTGSASTESLISCSTLYMVNTGNHEFVKNGAPTSVRVPVARVEPIGIYAYTAGFDLMDLDAIGVPSTELSIGARAVHNRYGVPDAAVTASCEATGGGGVVSIRSCGRVSAAPGTGGRASLSVNVTLGPLSAEVVFRVWGVHNLSVHVLNARLHRISAPGGCAWYQRTLCSVTAAVSTGGAVLEADVTDHVAVVSGDPGRAVVVNRTVQGVGIGASTIGVAGAKVPVRGAVVEVVGDGGVNITGLSVSALTGVEWQPFRSDAVSITSSLRFLSERLTDTRREATLIVQALFSDGTSQALHPRDGVLVEALKPRVLGVRVDGDSWIGSRIVDGEPSFCGDLVRARWMRCNGTMAEGAGAMDVELPRAVSGWVVCSTLDITSPSDPSALPPRSYPTHTSVVSAGVRFSDGSERELIADARTSVRIVSGAGFARLEGKRLVSLGGAGTVLLEATFAGFGGATGRLSISVHTRAGVSASLRCAGGPCASVMITSPTDPTTKPPFFFPSSFRGFRTFMTFRGGSAETEYTADPRWRLIVVSGAELATVTHGTVEGRGVNASGAGPGWAGISAWFEDGFDLLTPPATIRVLRSAAVSATITCGATECGRVRIAKEGDPAGAAPLSIPPSVDLSVHVLLADGRSVGLPFDARTAYRVLEGGRFIAMAGNRVVAAGAGQNDTGAVRIEATFPDVFEFSTPSVRLLVVRFKGLGVELIYYGGGSGDGRTLRQVHCSGGFEGVDARVSATLTDESVHDVTLFTSARSTNQSVAAARGSQVNGVGPGSATLVFVFANVTVARGIAVVPANVHLTGASVAGFPANLIGLPNTSTAMRIALTFASGAQVTTSLSERGMPWMEPGWLMGALLTFASDAASAVSVGRRDGLVTLQANWHEAVVLSAAGKVCDGLSIADARVSVSPNLLPSADGDVDIGSATGVALWPAAAGSGVRVPIFLRSDGLLKSFELRLSVDPDRLAVSGCGAGTDWLGGFSCTINDPPGTVFIVGADVTSGATGKRLSVASISVNATAAGIAEVSGVRVKVASSLGANLCPGCAIVAGRSPMRITALSNGPATRRLRRRPSQRRLQPPRRTRPDAHGDANGDGVFDSTDYLFAQEYSLAPESMLGCPAFGGIRCTAASNLTGWQLKQMDAVSDPLLPAEAPGGNDLGFLLSVYSGKQRFFDRWTTRSDSVSGLSLSVRLVDRDGWGASQQCGVRFILATASNGGARFRTQSNLTSEGVVVVAEHKGDGWYGIDSVGDLRAEEAVPFVFMIETKDGLGEGGDAMRRFPFYATRLPPYDAYYPAFRRFASIRILEHNATLTASTTSTTPTTPTTETATLTTPTTETVIQTPAPQPALTTPTTETAIQTPAPQPALTTETVVTVAASGSLLALLGLIGVARRYWQTAVPPAAIGGRPTASVAPVLRVRLTRQSLGLSPVI